jgi:protein-L-isoaspartate(D-aspartate) O-methyltransferase
MHAHRPLAVGIGIAAIAVILYVVWRGFQSADHQGRSPPFTSESTVRASQSQTQDEAVKTKTDVKDDEYADRRRRMIEKQLRSRDIVDRRVLEVMQAVQRHLFVPLRVRESSYRDGPLPIGHDQTISQPYIVALMTQLARTRPDAKALDVGTGSGYQAAVLAKLCTHVYSIEIVEPLATEAKRRLKELGYDNVTVRCGDGYQGWLEHAPFDLIIVAAAPNHVPQPLVDQLAVGGRLIIPVGKFSQRLTVIEKLEDGSIREMNVIPVVFVPMTGEAQKRDKS